ncbi:hypothetical protein BD770DRAFT_399505 [Pilaira anomala]|nr:hypothetical protein BD770DRAFT_399505 [Pilaira anomala]
MPPRAKRKTNVDTHSQKIDSYFKPLPKVKRKVENDENSQEAGRPSPSPPSSQSKPLKSFGENRTGTTTTTTTPFGLKSENENIGTKSFGLQGNKDDCKTFGTTNALKWHQQFDRQPLREISVAPVSIKMSSICRPVQHTFQVLSDQEIERGIEQSTSSRSRYDDNSRPTEVNSSLDSNYSNVKSPILSYPGQSDTQDSFEVYADEAQISDTVRGGIIHSVTNSDDESSPEDKFEVYVDNQEEDKFEVYVDNQAEQEEGFEVYADKDNAYTDKFEVYLDNSSEDGNKFEVYEDQDNESDQDSKFEVYVDKGNESDQDSKFEVYEDQDNESDQDSKFKVYVDENDTQSNNSTTTTCTIKDDSELRIKSSSTITQHQLKEDRRNKENEPVSDSEEKSSTIVNSPIVKKSSSTLPDFFKRGTSSRSTYGSSSNGFFDQYDEHVKFDDSEIPEEFSINEFTSEFTPEFKEPSVPLFSSKQKHLLQERKEKR